MRSLVVLAALAAPVLAQPVPAVPADALAALTGPLAFVENQGQWPDDVLFLARTGGADAWVTADGVTFDFYAVERERGGVEGPLHEGAEASRRRGHVVVMRFEGGHAGRATGHGRQAAYHNYFLGDDPARWASRVPLYDEVVLESLYDGVDLRLYSEEGHLRYDLVVAPGADVSGVRMRMEGADGVGLTVDGALSMRTALGAVEHRGLLAYHEGAGGRREAVASAFVVGADGTVSFAVERADPARRLVIDPLLWATFLGGSLGDYASGVAVGADGSATVVGGTSSGNFPTVPGAYDATYNLGGDAFVTRLAPGGSTLIYSTYLGGMAPETAAGVALGTDGSATVAGSTRSSDFPTTPGAFDTSFNGGTPSTGGDAFVIRLAPDGGSLLYGTFLGGSVGDVAGGVAVGADGAATVAGWTFSADFPTTPGAYDDFYNADADVFVTRLAPDGGSLLYSTFIGSPGGDFATGVAVGADGAATVAGRTLSPIFPTTPGAFDTSFNGWIDVFVTRLAPDGGSLLYSTYLGGAEREEAHGGVAVSADGSAVVAGFTVSAR